VKQRGGGTVVKKGDRRYSSETKGGKRYRVKQRFGRRRRYTVAKKRGYL
jgi:hypothetical protein